MMPVLFSCGLFSIYTYGFFAAAAFLAASFLITKEAARRGMNAESISAFTLYILISGIVSARLLYVVLNWSDFAAHPLEIIKLNHGGLIWFGGFIGALVFGIFFLRSKQLPVLGVLDLCAPYVALAQAIGRIGCFFNGCCYGKPFPHGIYFPLHGETLFPSQILDSFTLLAVFVILRTLSLRTLRPGQVFSAYLMLAALQRFFLEFLRGDSRPFYFSLSLFQWICIGLFIAGIILYFKIQRLGSKSHRVKE